METVLKNHRTLITLLGLWATPFFLSHFKNIDKRRVVASKKSSVFFTKVKKKEKEKAFKPRQNHNESIFEIKTVSPCILNTCLAMAPLVREGSPRRLRKKPFSNEGPSKKESGVSPPLVAVL